MADHVPGSMDVTAQEKAYAGFIKFVVRGAIICIVALVVLALVNG